MKSSLLALLERKAGEFRQSIGLSDAEAVNLKSLLLKLNVLTVFRPLSDKFSGMSLKSPHGERFMLINSNQPRCRQHFTIAHELYHLFIESNPIPHNCEVEGAKSESEQCADAFALLFLIPYKGLLQMIPSKELESRAISLATIIRLEHYFSVSRQAILNRLVDTKFISRAHRESLLSIPVVSSAREYGYDTSLYKSGNQNLIIGDFGEKARKLYDDEKISEGHYHELLGKIGIYGDEN